MVKNQFKENEMSETKRRAKYTLEYKMEAVRLVKGGQAVSVTAKILGIPKASLDNWVKLSAKGQLKGAGDKPVSPEQMELARLRAELARVKMERDILKNRPRGAPRPFCLETLGRLARRGCGVCMSSHHRVTVAVHFRGVQTYAR
jgi:transposase